VLAARKALQRVHAAWQARLNTGQHVAGAVHEVYGTTGSYYFFRQGKQPPDMQPIRQVQQPGPQGALISLSQPGGTAAAATVFADYYDATAGGLFAVRPTDAAAQQLLLASVDRTMSQQEAQQCAGSTADGRLTQEEAAAALRSLPRGKSPGTDGLTYEVYSAFWADISELDDSRLQQCVPGQHTGAATAVQPVSAWASLPSFIRVGASHGSCRTATGQ